MWCWWKFSFTVAVINELLQLGPSIQASSHHSWRRRRTLYTKESWTYPVDRAWATRRSTWCSFWIHECIRRHSEASVLEKNEGKISKSTSRPVKPTSPINRSPQNQFKWCFGTAYSSVSMAINFPRLHHRVTQEPRIRLNCCSLVLPVQDGWFHTVAELFIECVLCNCEGENVTSCLHWFQLLHLISRPLYTQISCYSSCYMFTSQPDSRIISVARHQSVRRQWTTVEFLFLMDFREFKSVWVQQYLKHFREKHWRTSILSNAMVWLSIYSELSITWSRDHCREQPMRAGYWRQTRARGDVRIEGV